MCIHCGPLIKAIDAYLAKEDNDLVEQLTLEGYADAEGTVETINKLEEYVTNILNKDCDSLLKELDGAVDLKTFFEDNWPKIKRKSTVAQQLFDTFYSEFSTIMPHLVELYVWETDAELTVTRISNRTTDWITSWSGDLADIMQLNTHTAIEQILSTGLSDGLSIAEISDKIASSGIRSPGYRARCAALTETLRAHGYAQLESYVQSPAVENKMWRHTGAYRNDPRPNHVDMDGVIVPKNEPFTLHGADGGTYYPMVPRDINLPVGETANCHCLLQPVVNADILGLSLEERQKLQQAAIDADDEAWKAELNERNKAKAGIE